MARANGGTVHGAFADSARRSPDAIALEDASRRLTFAELGRAASRLARRLRALGVRPERYVGVSAARSVDTIVGILAVAKAGGAYVPIDPELPRARREGMVARCAIDVLLYVGARPGLAAHEIALDAPVEDAPDFEDDAHPDHPFVVLHTSGTTGEPKAVVLAHRGIVAYLDELVRSWRVGPDDRLVQFSTLSFDVSVEEIALAWRAGARLFVRSEEMLAPEALLDACAERGLTLVEIPTAYLPLLTSAVEQRGGWPPSLRLVCVGGERLQTSWLAAYLRDPSAPRLVSMYGPTEASISVAACEARDSVGRDAPLGKPVPGCEVYVLDASMRPAASGEVYVGGACLARGYLGAAAATAERFVPSPFAAGARLYRTGDLARVDADGFLEYVGRTDEQVKVRGFRVELGEIEAALMQLEGVREAVAIARDDAGTKQLVAYVVADADGDFREALREKLPAYAVPAAIVRLPKMPLTDRGKVDRRHLPAPTFAGAEHVAPRNATEASLAAIFGEVLRVARVGVNDDFFALGGHSLLATRVASQAAARVGVAVPVRWLFEARTVAALAERVAASARSAADEIAPVPRDQPLRASHAQERLWFLAELSPGASTYHVATVFRLRGALDEGALRRALDLLVERHESLRTALVATDGKVQVRIEGERMPFALREAANLADARRFVHEEMARPFDLARAPLVRTALARVADDDHLFGIVMHHVVTDGWSCQVLERELSEAYDALRHHRAVRLAPLPVQYVDYAAWERAQKNEDLAFWTEHLRGAPTAIELPTDRPRPATRSERGGSVAFELAIDAVRAFARAHGATAFMVLLAAFDVFLARHTGQEDVVVGTPTANRAHAALDGVVGFFVNTLAIRTNVGGLRSFADVVARVKTTTIDALAHQRLPFERLVEALRPPRDPSRTPVFQVMFAYLEEPAPMLGDLAVEREPDGLDAAKFDLVLNVNDVRATFEYDAALFDRATVERFAARFRALVAAAIASPASDFRTLPILSDDERRVLVAWNDTARTYDERPVHVQIAARAALQPDALAVADEHERRSYAELERGANRIANALRNRGFRAGDRALIWLPRSVGMVLGELAVMKTGGTYVPLDPSHPAERLAVIAKDVGTRWLLSTRDTAGADLGVAPLFVDDLEREGDDAPVAAPTSPRGPVHIIYTSGTTGKPKGAVVEHRGLANVVAESVRGFELTATDHVTQFSAPAFDAKTIEIWPALVAGAALFIVPDAVRTSAPALAAWWRAREITVAFVPTVLAELMMGERAPPTLRLMTCGGQALRRRPAADAMYRLRNLYGPTEATSFVTAEPVAPGPEPVTTIGRPIQNAQIYVLDAALEPAPIGVFGDLWIAGVPVAQAYLGMPALTAEKFLPDPFGSARMYASGDRARWLPDGRLEFAGRNDDQVKIRGFRIELGDIEHAIRQLDGVREVTVVARDERLVAYVVGGAVTPAALQTKLPEYMIPAVIVPLERLPLTSNGKVDKKALPAPMVAADDYAPPRTETESAIVTTYAGVLRVERVGVNDDFFALGGHSLLATEAAARLSKRLGRDVPVRDVFAFPTAARLAEHLDAARVRVEPPPITASNGPDVTSFEEAYVLGWEAHRPPSAVWNHGESLELVGPLDEGRLEEAFRRTLHRQDALLRTFASRSAAAAVRLAGADEVPWHALDVAGATEEETQRIAAAHVTVPFGFDGTPLVRAFLLRQGPGRNTLVLNWHQAVHDHDSASAFLLTSEVMATYERVGRGEPELPPLPVRYADYAKWARAWFDGPDGAADLAALRRQYAGAAPIRVADRVSEGPRSVALAASSFLLDADASRRFMEACRRASVTRFMGAFAAVAVLMHRWRGAHDVPLMTLRNSRTRRPELAALAGRFTGPVPMLMRVEEGATWAELFDAAKRAALLAFGERGPTPSTHVLDTDIPVDHPLGALTLNDMGVNTRRIEPIAAGELRFRPSHLDTGVGARAMLQVGCITPTAGDERIAFVVGGVRDRFEDATIPALAKMLEGIVRSIDLSERPSPRTAPRRATVAFRDPRTAPKDGLVAVTSDVPADALEDAYRAGIFPFPIPADPASASAPAVRWVSPDPRVVVPLNEPPRWNRQFRQQAQNHAYEVTLDHDFSGVLRMCASTRAETWMHPALIAAYEELHRRGVAHSVEVWDAGELVGGVYGVAMGGFFAAESMFHTRKNASKVAFVALVRKLTAAGYALVDGQFPAPHTRSFGFVEIDRNDYLDRLAKAVAMAPDPLLRTTLTPSPTPRT